MGPRREILAPYEAVPMVQHAQLSSPLVEHMAWPSVAATLLGGLCVGYMPQTLSMWDMGSEDDGGWLILGSQEK